MTQYEMTEKLSEKMNVTLEEAKTALEATEWNMLDAALLLEKAQAEAAKQADAQAEKEAQAETEAPRTEKGHRPAEGLRHVGLVIRHLFERGNRNRFEVRRKDEVLLEMPVTALALLLIFAFHFCIPALIIGLFAGCRYAFSGEDLGRENLNRAMDAAADAAQQVKAEVAAEL